MGNQKRGFIVQSPIDVVLLQALYYKTGSFKYIAMYLNDRVL